MKECFLIAVLSISISPAILSQSAYIGNPSFEGVPGQGNMPAGWTACNTESTPDIQPVNVLLDPTDGQSYVGLVMRGPGDQNPKNEDIVTALNQTLYRDSSYILSIDLAYAPYLTEGEVAYDNVPQLRISGGSEECITGEVFVVTEPIDNSEWLRYCFIITPTKNTNYISFEIFASQLQASYLVMDNITLEPFRIKGANHVCKGSANHVYSIPEMTCAVTINATYTGEGTTLSYANNTMIMNFGENATDGDLIVRFMNSLSEPDSIIFPITVDAGFPGSGTIIGTDRVCQGQKLEYYHADVSNTTIFNWSYSGIGADIKVYDEDITVDFSEDATSGTLTLLPQNGCGVGAEMSFEITMVPLPVNAGLITGESVVCTGQTEIYHIPGITYADKYRWSYTGTGVSMSEGTLDLEITFGDGATGGYLSVAGINACGEGKRSVDFIVFLNRPPEHASVIEGAAEICPSQEGVVFKTSDIPHATEYVWRYTGFGAEIIGNTNEVEMSFLPEATNGELTVTGRNVCGTGNPSPAHQIAVSNIPASPGEISGKAELCSEDGGEFTIQPVTNATSYTWIYDGSGATINENGSSAVIKFTEHETTGKLTVVAVNQCGSSEPSAPLTLRASSCIFFVPNAFTPNNDGINDLFVIRNIDNTAKLIIFDRSGKVVYESANYSNDWDGRDKDGRILPTDTYWYVLSVEGLAKDVKGYVFLKR